MTIPIEAMVGSFTEPKKDSEDTDTPEQNESTKKDEEKK